MAGRQAGVLAGPDEDSKCIPYSVFFVGSKFRSFDSLSAQNEYFHTNYMGVRYKCVHKG